MDASLAPSANEPITLACALAVEERAARRGGARAVVRVGVGLAARAVPEGRIVSFGLAGALVPEIREGAVLTATRVVGEDGSVLWEGEAVQVPGATPAVLCGAGRVVDAPSDRAELARRSGAVAVDMESAALAASGRLAGAIRAVSDSPSRPVGRLARASKPDGSVAWGAVVAALITEPRTAVRASRAARRALAALERAAAAVAARAA